ncbi:glycosyltransferase [Kineococcus auxinigenes]|uniref:glycosyltransferase n=1 Tax=unclassified Kineococcus TaxID=2621656 RepID=UPI003D7C55E9
MGPAPRPPVVHVTWQRHAGRAAEIAGSLGGRALHVHPLGGRSKWRVAGRYGLSVALTAAGLVRHRPRSVIVTNPPVFPALVVAGYAACARVPFALDSHTSSFGVKGNAVARRMLGVHRWLARRADTVMVASPEWADVVDGWGGRGLVVHEAPPGWEAAPPRTGRPTVLFVGVFADDEPVREVVEAARSLPEVRVRITGDLERCPEDLRRSAPANVEFTGFLGPREYRAAVEAADVLLTLTTERTSVMRAGYEAAYVGRRLVVSDWPVLREVFPHAWHTDHEPASIARALRAALDDTGDGEREERARREQTARWDEQRARLVAALRLSAGGSVAPAPVLETRT